MGLLLRDKFKKTIHKVETHRLSGKEKVLDTAVSKEGHAHSILGHKRTNEYSFHWKMCNCNQCFLLPTL